MLGDTTFRIYVETHDYLRTVSIVPVTDRYDGVTLIMVPAEGGGWKTLEFNEKEPIPSDIPVLRIPSEWAEKIYHALGERLHPKGTATEEELKATKYHLEDMRALTFGRAQPTKETPDA